MKDVFDFLGQLAETLMFIVLFGGASYLGWLSWASKDVYLLVAAMGVLAVIGLLAILETTARMLGRMHRIEMAVLSEREVKPIAAQTIPDAKPVPQVSKPVPVIKIPDLNEAVERLNRKKAEEPAKAVPTEQQQPKAEPAKVAEKPIEKPAPAVAPDLSKPVVQPVKKYPFGRKPKEEPKPAAEAVVETPKPDVESHGNGAHNESATSISKICPKCGVADKMKKFGKHEGRQKWHCGNCGKTTVEPIKAIGVAS